MIRTYKYIVHAGLQQEIQIIFGKTSDVIGFLRSGWGFQYIEKGDFRADLMPFLPVYANMFTQACTFSKHSKVSGINLWKGKSCECMLPEALP